MKIEEMKMEVEIPEGVQVSQETDKLNFKGPKGEISRVFKSLRVKIEIKDNKVVLSAKKATKNEKRMMGTFRAHVRNMFEGVVNAYVYKLKICSGHFPMNVAVKGDEFTVKNFLGEKFPRIVKLNKDINVKVDGVIITLEGVDKEIVGQCAANIEQLTRITNKDRRIFQDGIWITEKAGKKI